MYGHWVLQASDRIGCKSFLQTHRLVSYPMEPFLAQLRRAFPTSGTRSGLDAKPLLQPRCEMGRTAPECDSKRGKSAPEDQSCSQPWLVLLSSVMVFAYSTERTNTGNTPPSPFFLPGRPYHLTFTNVSNGLMFHSHARVRVRL